ncbi:MAG TPA: peptidoglycan-binding domain-containing protein [Chthoniobacteraceae bacterium]|nr:peptidoglycan-binding domain-containing protein [Chthoniobacteraceae bacterium]
MKRSLLLIAFLGLAVVSLHADEAVLLAQRSLKELGFYQGAEDGTVNVLFKGAVRRFQIHRGLTPTGELNAETTEAMREAASEQTPPPSASAPATEDAVSNEVEQSDREFLDRGAPPPNALPPPASRPPEPRPLPPGPPASPRTPAPVPSSGYAGLFRGTPYFNAPPQVQRDTVLKAQRLLAGRRYYRGPIDGLPGAMTGEAIVAYQRANQLRPSGRLDLDTLAVMRLLPAVGRPLPPRGAVRGIPLD